MRKKRKHFSKKSSRKSSRFSKPIANNYGGKITRADIIALLYKAENPLSPNGMLKQLSLPGNVKRDLKTLLGDLLASQTIIKADKKHYLLCKKHNLHTGTIDMNPRGFGFVSIASKKEKGRSGKDPFLSASRLKGAMHGDEVLIEIDKIRKDGRPLATVLKVLNRAMTQIAGFFAPRHGALMIAPEDPRFPFQITVNSVPDDVRKGDAVIVKLDIASLETSNPRGKITEVLGNPDNIDVQMRLVIEKHKLPHVFSKKALEEAQKATSLINDEKGRTDLRQIQHVTIDGETAKDFDDAVAVIKTRQGFRLYVSIADVSHFVRNGSILDQEAYQRGTSIYFPGRVIPMLPENLSNNLCSLVPDEDRLTFTAILDFDRQGNRQKKSFTKSIIRSHKRLTYTTVKEILVDKKPAVRRTHKPFLTPLKWAGELATQLGKRRTARGSIGFTLPEPELILDDSGNIASVNRAERNFAHQIIEEFMLAANEAVAEFFTETSTDALYRIHKRPNQEKVLEFTAFASSLGLEIPSYRQDPDWFGQVLQLVKDSPKEYIINNLLLRTMQQARYSPDNDGHFGLAATDYTHFTSPIRRYPDLMVHRALELLLQKKSKKSSGLSHNDLEQAGDFLSARERIAVTAERDINDRLKVRYMRNHIGDSFKAIISGVSGFGFFVELLDLFISGAVALTDLTDDYYLLDAKHHRFIGDVTLNIYQMGELVDVTVISVDEQKNRINFAVTDKEQR